MIAEKTLQKTIYLKAQKETVWCYLTDPSKMELWFHRPKEPLMENADYVMFGRDSGEKLMWGKVRKFLPFDELEYTFSIKPMGDTESIVHWKLVDVGDGTRLELTHTGLPQSSDAFGLLLALDKGWDGHFNEMRISLHGG